MRKFLEQSEIPRISEDEAEKLTYEIQKKIAKNKKFDEVFDTEPRNSIFFALHDGCFGTRDRKCPADHDSDTAGHGWWGMFTAAGERRVGDVVRATIARLRKLEAKRKKALFGK